LTHTVEFVDARYRWKIDWHQWGGSVEYNAIQTTTPESRRCCLVNCNAPSSIRTYQHAPYGPTRK